MHYVHFNSSLYVMLFVFALKLHSFPMKSEILPCPRNFNYTILLKSNIFHTKNDKNQEFS